MRATGIMSDASAHYSRLHYSNVSVPRQDSWRPQDTHVEKDLKSILFDTKPPKAFQSSNEFLNWVSLVCRSSLCASPQLDSHQVAVPRYVDNFGPSIQLGRAMRRTKCWDLPIPICLLISGVNCCSEAALAECLADAERAAR